MVDQPATAVQEDSCHQVTCHIGLQASSCELTRCSQRTQHARTADHQQATHATLTRTFRFRCSAGCCHLHVARLQKPWHSKLRHALLWSSTRARTPAKLMGVTTNGFSSQPRSLTFGESCVARSSAPATFERTSRVYAL